MGTLTSKCTCGDSPDYVDYVKTAVNQVKWRCEDLVIKWSITSGDTRRDHGGSVTDTRLQVGLVVSSSKPWVNYLPGLGLKTEGGSRDGMWHHCRVHVKETTS